MFVNGKRLLDAAPIREMLTGKEKAGGVTYGLAEVGYDVRIRQGLRFFRDAYGNKVVQVTEDGIAQRYIGWVVNVNVLEEFTMPMDLVGIGMPKSTWNRQHLRLGNPVIEPGWNGYLTISLDYAGEDELIVEPGSGIMQVLFSRIEDEASYEGRYQNQANTIVGAINAE